MTKEVITISLDLTIEYAAKIMSYNNVSSIIVINKGELSGIITEKDILNKVVAKGLNPRETTIKNVMSTHLITVTPDTPLEEANKIMLENKIKKLPVVDDNNKKLLGILSQTDFARMHSKIIEAARMTSNAKDDTSFCNGLQGKDIGQYLEYQSTLRYDLENKCVNPKIELTILTTICAFMNAEGGDLVIGVSEDRKIVGLTHDFKSLKIKNKDGFESKLITLISESLGDASLKFIKISFPELEGKEICRVNVLPGVEPTFLREDGRETFFVRTGDCSKCYSLSETIKYVREQWSEDGAPVNVAEHLEKPSQASKHQILA